MEKYHHNSVNTGELKCVSQKDGQEGIHKTPAVMKEKNVATTERNLRQHTSSVKRKCRFQNMKKKLFSWTPCIVDINNIAYTNIGTCGTFTDFMAEDIASKENRELSEAYFFSVLWD